MLRHLLLFLLLPFGLSAQYFQQDLAYRINANLDDKKHVLHASLELDYTNNSPDELDTIFFHCWPRAYATDRSAFAKQKLRDGKTRFHFSENHQRGNMDSLHFQVDGNLVAWSFHRQHPDIAILPLSETLKPGQTITITTPFRVKIPDSFSRLGHVGDSYQMTQWYPKPAVYDQDGWHPMPYLDRGEFYSEFGSFDVSITLPQNYIVAATGTLETSSELQFLEQKAIRDANELANRTDLSTSFEKESFPASSQSQKTIRYKAEKVHDFAWFADKRFKVLSMNMYNPATGKNIKVWSFFTETEAEYWKNSLTYLEHAIEFYSEKVGLYPYPQVTAVQSALSAGGGMEYPMITVIGRNTSAASLDEVLAHEVGHNWFYGILATNERTHPWMDEGFNSYYEALYMQRHYPEAASDWQIMNQEIDIDLLGYRYQNRLRNGQSPDMDSDSMWANNYWLNAYSKPDLALQHLALHYGKGAVDKAMRAYYEQWKFKHPRPQDVKAVFEQSIGADLDWLFDGFLMSDEVVDFYLTKGKNGQVLVKRKGNINAPVIVEKLNDPDNPIVINEIPEDGYALPKGNYRLNGGPLDINPGNNYNKRSLKLQPLIVPESNDGSRQLFYLPLIGANAQNGFILGAALHNRPLEPKQLEFMLAPLYGFKSKSLNGFTGLRWRLPITQSKAFRTITLSTGFQRFAYREFRETPYHYHRLGVSAAFDFNHAAIRNLKSGIQLQFIGLSEDRPDFDSMGDLRGSKAENSRFIRFRYNREEADPINPRSLSLKLEHGAPSGPLVENFTKAELELKGGYQYQKHKFINWRIFGGYFLSNKLRERNFTPDYSFSLAANAAADYAYDGIFLGRQDDRSYGQQLRQQMGGFRTPIDPALGFGRSNNYMVTTNLDFALPFTPEKFPLGVFLDGGIYGRSPIRNDSESALQWAGGLSLTFLDGAVGIYAPLVASPELRNTLEQRGNLLQRLSFRLSFSNWLPWKKIDEIKI